MLKFAHFQWVLSVASSLALFACGDGGGGGGDETGTGTGTDTGGTPSTTGADPTGDTEPPTGDSTGDPDVPGLLDAPTRGGPIHINDDGSAMAVANKATGDVTLFSLPDVAELARVEIGLEPVSVSWNPDNSTLYVVNRRAGNVVELLDANTDAPTVGGSVDVGAELIHGALSPRGTRLYVTSWVDGTLNVIDTSDMSVAQQIELGGAPYAVCVTNDVDEDEDDETIFVTDFYGRPGPGREAEDDARLGRVFRINAGDLSVDESTLDTFSDSGVAGFEDRGFYPNQLYSCVVNDDLVYVTAVGASPEPFDGVTPPNTDFHQNVQGMVGVLDIDTGDEITGRSANLNALVGPLSAPKRFVAVPMDIAFAPNSEFGYIASTASNSVLRVDWSQSPPVAGSPSGAAFLPTAPSPTGIAIRESTAYTYNEVDRSVSVIDLAQQETVQMSVESAPQPTDAQQVAELRGQKFFNTGLARWSANGWVSCLACHPAGLTDNVTWTFPAGPRQTVDLSGSFNDGATVQRVFNWTAIFDEVHDFELNTRGVAGGTGAIVSSADLNADGTANTGARIDFVGPGGVLDPLNGFNIGSTRAVAATGAVPDDWDDINAYVATLRAPTAATLYEGDPGAGRVIFDEAGCQNCHGGSLWTLSERYYNPQLDQDPRTLTLASQGITSIDVRPDQVTETDPNLVDVLELDGNGPPHRHSCVVRQVGTFGELGPSGRGADEIRQNGGAAQGVSGFNVPSLLGASMGGPYLHNGAAETLEELLDPAGDYGNHVRAGNQVFSPTDEELADLIAFVRSIDDDTEAFSIDPEFVFCPSGLTFP